MFGVARETCGVECEGVGGPDDDGDIGSVTQSLSMLVIVTMDRWVNTLLPMRSSRDDLCDCMGQGRGRVHVENGEGILAFDQATGGQNHRNEMCAGVLKKWQ